LSYEAPRVSVYKRSRKLQALECHNGTTKHPFQQLL